MKRNLSLILFVCFSGVVEIFSNPALFNKAAVVIVDMQPDFMKASLDAGKKDGSLAVTGADSDFGKKVINATKSLESLHGGSKNFSVFCTQDFHPAGHVSFRSTFFEMDADGSVKEEAGKPVLKSGEIKIGDKVLTDDEKKALNPTIIFAEKDKAAHLYSVVSPFTKKEQMLWPEHCVQNTPGSAIIPGFEDAPIFPKGTDVKYDSYSGVKDDGGKETDLVKKLTEADRKVVFVCGLALDYCVKATAIDLKDKGFKVILVPQLCKSVNPEICKTGTADHKKMVQEFKDAGVSLMSDDEFNKFFKPDGSLVKPVTKSEKRNTEFVQKMSNLVEPSETGNSQNSSFKNIVQAAKDHKWPLAVVTVLSAAGIFALVKRNVDSKKVKDHLNKN